MNISGDMRVWLAGASLTVAAALPGCDADDPAGAVEESGDPGVVEAFAPTQAQTDERADGIPDEAADERFDDVRLRIEATSPLLFDPLRFTVQPGQWVEIELINVDDMRHNLLVVRPDTREAVVQAVEAMGAEAADRAYVPEMDEVIASTPVLSSGERYTLRFRAPEEPGVYTYVCTYPGHGQVMFGAMYVQEADAPELVALWEDEHIPDFHRPAPPRNDDALIDTLRPSGSQDWHAYELTYPALYRTVMPGYISPASIAVGLPGGESYAWDAGFSRLRYVWFGDFIDPTPHWRGRGNDRAEVRGDIWYEETGGYPLRFGDDAREPDEDTIRFAGYTLDEQGYPEFRYHIDDMTVRERIVERSDGRGIERTFRIDDATQRVWFVRPTDTDAHFTSTGGRWAQDAPHMLELSPQEAEMFIVTIAPDQEPDHD